MFKSKLIALQHPAPESVNLNDRNVFASTILWLEDQKIRHYRIEDREELRKVDDLEAWEKAYEKFKVDLGVPQFETPQEELTWLLSYAVRLEFSDTSDCFKDINSESILKKDSKCHEPTIKAENFFDNMDFQHKDFIAGVRRMGSKLGVPQHSNHLIQLEAIARVIDDKLSSKAANNPIVEGTPFPFERDQILVGTNDPALEHPAKILRLLQIQNYRQLQTKINETIAAVQSLTANPKTDTKLGKVGF